MLWLVFAAMAALAVGFIVLPLFRRPADGRPRRAEYDIAVYKDQLREIERDRARGVLDDAQAAAARTEVERRLLAAATTDEGAVPSAQAAAPATPAGRMPWRLAMIAGLFVIAVAGVVYLEHGTPWLANLQDYSTGREPAAADQFAELIAEVERRLAETPDDPRGWMVLARGYARMGRVADATMAQQRALSLTPDDGEAAQIAVGFAQVLVEEARGAVTPAARAAFAEALQRDAKNVPARYFLGLAKLQDGDARGAVADWRALLADAPADASWRAGLAERIARLQLTDARGGDESARQATIESMVEGLAARLSAAGEGGGTAEEWARLGRSYRVLGRMEQARDAYGEAVKRKPDDVTMLRDHAAAVRDANGERSGSYRAALRRLRDQLPEGSAERAALDEQMKALQ